MTGTFLPTSAFWTSAQEEPPPEVWLRVQRLRDAAAELQPPVPLEPWQEEWLLKKSDHLVGCMHRYPHRWRMIGTQKVPMDWLINGQQLLPVGAQELLLRPSRPNSFKTPEEKKFAAQQHFLWTKAGAHFPISEGKPGPCHLVHKPGKKLFRLVSDETEVNKCLPHRPSRQGGLKQLLYMARPGDWAVDCDLADGYFQLLTALTACMFCCWASPMEPEQLFGFVVPMFGLCTVPWTFNKALKPLVSFFRRCLLSCWQYFDDFAFLHRDRLALTRLVEKLIRPIFKWLNLSIEESKSHWEPTQTLVKMGYEINLQFCLITITEEKRLKVAEAVQDLAEALRNRHQAQVRLIASVNGKLMAMDQAFYLLECCAFTASERLPTLCRALQLGRQ
jgi:hypothetical protein